MTEREKANFSHKLFDEIGLIDDRFIYEASTPYVPKRKFGAIGKILVIAAALTLTLCIIAGTLLTGALFIIVGNSKSDYDNASGEPPTENVTDDNGSYATLSDRLDAIGKQENYSTLSKEDVELFDSTPKVVWSAEDGDGVHVREISYAQASSLIEKMSKAEGTEISDGSGEGCTSVWIVLGNGQVITPHLAYSSGNVGYGELFDYVREYEPSEELTGLLIDTVS